MTVREPGHLGAWCGIALGVCWSGMLLIVFRLPALDSEHAVDVYWHHHRTLTQVVIAMVVLGYPLLLVWLAEVRRRWGDHSPTGQLLGTTTHTAGLMFITTLNVALGLASAGGQLIGHGRRDLGYALHVGAFVLAAPATSLGVALCGGLAWAAWTGALSPRWLRWPTAVAAATNALTLGGLFTLTGSWNSGDGVLGGIALPLGTLTVVVVLASGSWLRDGHASTPEGDGSAETLPI